ncbi:quinolinate synthetase [Halobacillus karajensis]|uniref:Quinolinate synthase n=1 Tax=Halobacillus karajensis TaxID=195088 RepID=A0A024PAE8_9BACI|nr:quinolinate synthase NadA [Halobacillus karajensis]CDQ21467.1 Quinolinate synthase A [Halobacillus karajensis]CDQ25402.1 Quinolinate synthase A [Halobacillus karajensis]CDQ29726.1 Quinolinate synthase A [Halobacillus karajensis]SEI07966.1 quinolinate synthetase [Halobacillus karajensis]
MNLFSTIEKSTLPETYRKMSPADLRLLVSRVKKELGSRLFIPGHHYQKDEVIQFADARGDSLKLAQLSASQQDAESIVFCGVHFMAETADILTQADQHVYLPDMRAGCSMADMANIQQTEKAWQYLMDMFEDTILPLTYVNSTAAIKAFVGKNGGATVTSSNAADMLNWAFTQKERILFLPDQHLGRNTAYDLGIPLDQMAVWDPIMEELLYKGPLHNIKVILWKGHCSVHENFRVTNVEQVRRDYPEMKVIVHPECSREVVELSDISGSTNSIINAIKQAPPGSQWAIGTEMNLVKRIIQENPDKHIISLNPRMCPCLTMNRIDLPHLAWSLESLAEGQPQNLIQVDRSVATDAKKALDRMLVRT